MDNALEVDYIKMARFIYEMFVIHIYDIIPHPEGLEGITVDAGDVLITLINEIPNDNLIITTEDQILNVYEKYIKGNKDKCYYYYCFILGYNVYKGYYTEFRGALIRHRKWWQFWLSEYVLDDDTRIFRKVETNKSV